MPTDVLPVAWRDDTAPGLLGVISVVLSDLALKQPSDARVSDLIDVLNAKLQAGQQDEASTTDAKRHVAYLQLYGSRVRPSRLLRGLMLGESESNARLIAVTSIGEPRAYLDEPELLSLDSSSYDAMPPTQDASPEPERTSVFGRLGEITHGLSCRYDDAVDAVFSRAPTSRSVTRSRCASKFADVSDNSLLKQQAFSDTAPRWRKCRKGLNIEGRCVNQSCPAFRRMVIHPNGFESFNLTCDGQVACPLCRVKIMPVTCGFYDCVWKFEGVRASDRCFLSSAWKPALGHQYHTFDSDESHGSVEWESLLIVVKPRKDGQLAKLVAPVEDVAVRVDEQQLGMCVMCWEAVDAAPAQSPSCGHILHRTCADEWAGWCRRSAATARCPACQQPLATACTQN